MKKSRPFESPPATPNRAMSLVGTGTNVVGHWKTDDSVQIDGRVEGSMEAAEVISIGKDGVVIGDITARDAVLDGRVQGNLTIGSLVKLKAGCTVTGEIDAERILIEEGATVNATVRTGAGRSQPPAS